MVASSVQLSICHHQGAPLSKQRLAYWMMDVIAKQAWCLASTVTCQSTCQGSSLPYGHYLEVCHSRKSVLPPGCYCAPSPGCTVLTSVLLMVWVISKHLSIQFQNVVVLPIIVIQVIIILLGGVNYAAYNLLPKWAFRAQNDISFDHSWYKVGKDMDMVEIFPSKDKYKVILTDTPV